MAWTLQTPTLDLFLDALGKIEDPHILELATLRWEADKPTHHKVWAPDANWVLSDWEAGVDVDVVADAHDLSPFPTGSFDALIACSLLEHVKRPWLVLEAMSRVLAPDGILLLTTHQSFPLHGYPDDYFRFSTQALTVLAEDAGLEVIQVKHEFPCRIIPDPRIPVWNTAAEAFLNVELFARKP